MTSLNLSPLGEKTSPVNFENLNRPVERQNNVPSPLTAGSSPTHIPYNSLAGRRISIESPLTRLRSESETSLSSLEIRPRSDSSSSEISFSSESPSPGRSRGNSIEDSRFLIEEFRDFQTDLSNIKNGSYEYMQVRLPRDRDPLKPRFAFFLTEESSPISGLWQNSAVLKFDKNEIVEVSNIDKDGNSVGYESFKEVLVELLKSEKLKSNDLTIRFRAENGDILHFKNESAKVFLQAINHVSNRGAMAQEAAIGLAAKTPYHQFSFLVYFDTIFNEHHVIVGNPDKTDEFLAFPYEGQKTLDHVSSISKLWRQNIISKREGDVKVRTALSKAEPLPLFTCIEFSKDKKLHRSKTPLVAGKDYEVWIDAEFENSKSSETSKNLLLIGTEKIDNWEPNMTVKFDEYGKIKSIRLIKTTRKSDLRAFLNCFKKFHSQDSLSTFFSVEVRTWTFNDVVKLENFFEKLLNKKSKGEAGAKEKAAAVASTESPLAKPSESDSKVAAAESIVSENLGLEVKRNASGEITYIKYNSKREGFTRKDFLEHLVYLKNQNKLSQNIEIIIVTGRKKTISFDSLEKAKNFLMIK